MRHGDAFSGVGGFALAARVVGWSTVWACEIEPSARAVYSERCGYDGLRFDTDIRESRDFPPIDILTGGFPCQDLSVAGRRRGLAGARSGLFFELVRILQESRPEWFVFENVPGLLSSHRGRDMALILDSLVECGYGVAYRILNAQFFGVAQRRRRVFFVGHSSGEWGRAAQILFERERGERNPAESGEAGPDVAGAIGSGASGGGGWRCGADEAAAGHVVVQQSIAHCVTGHEAKGGDPTTDNYIVADPLKTGSSQFGNGWTDGPIVAQCNGSNVGPLGTLRKGNGNEVPCVVWIFRRIEAARKGEALT